ncbi:MAG: hypothetical protein BRD31_06270 [Bacteroidetes bacterium QH_2_64_26]|nr:MAG: hypothetical protein BRD31_06270 [Bacteroidetes bacterium QH_2_64_26]
MPRKPLLREASVDGSVLTSCLYAVPGSMRAVVTEVEVRSVPFTTDENERWDLFSGPDLFCEVYGPSGNLVHATKVVSDVRPSDLPLTLDETFSLTDPGPHILRLLDADIGGSEIINRVAFEPGRLADSGPGAGPPRCVQFEEGDTKLQLNLSWKQLP